MTDLGARISDVRRHVLCLKQRELAAKMNLEPVTISRWERGISEPSIDNLRLLAKLSGRPVSWFYGEKVGA